jgi:iron complex outermembrane receptor protein
MAYVARRSVLSLAVISVFAAWNASAQEPAQPPSAGDEQPTTLAGLTVTAQKREEALQDVPIMLTVLPEQLLQDAGVSDIKDVQLLVPGLHVSSTTNESQTTARIRGVGTNGDNAGLESAVGVVIDGVYRPRTGVGFGDLGELERIEVLKGPQGTVFGKNTSAGVINVTSRRPSYTQSAEGEITVGNLGERGISGAYNDALGESAAFRIYAGKRERDGVVNVNTGKGPRPETLDGDRNFHTVRAQLLLEPSENLDINFIADFTSREENCCVGVTSVRSATGAGPVAIINGLAGGQGLIATPDLERRLAYANRSTEQDTKDKGISAELNWDSPLLGGATLTSITAFRDWTSLNAMDVDFTGADLIWREADPKGHSTAFETFSQEIRFTGSSDRIDWMFGVFYSDEKLDRYDQYKVGADYEPYLSTLVGSQVLGQLAAQLAPFGMSVNTANPATFFSQVSGRPFGTGFVGTGAQDAYFQKARSTAFFTNNTIHATDKLDFTVGLRYTHDKKDLTSLYSNPNGGAACAATMANPGGRVGAALAQRIPGFGNLPAATRAQLIGAVTPNVVGYMCLPWSNVMHNGRQTEQSSTEKEWSGTLKAAYRWNDNVMTYLSAARGYKGGGFNLDRVQSSNGLSSGTAGVMPVDDTSFVGEFVDSYELGAKTTWADGNLLLNGTLFYQEYSDFQLNSFLGTSYVVRSIPKVESRGVELDLLWQTGIRGLMFQGGVTYADSKYGNDALPDADLFLLPGNYISFAPLWSASASATYEWDIGDQLLGRLNIASKYMSKHNTGSDLDPQKAQDAYALVNARLGFGRADKRWMVEFWGQNLTDETYTQVGFDAPIQPGNWNVFLGAPRTYGVTLRLQY